MVDESLAREIHRRLSSYRAAFIYRDSANYYYLHVKHRKRHDDGRYADDAHSGMLDIDKMLVERSYVIVVHAHAAILVQEGKGVFVAGAKEKNVRVDRGTVSQTELGLAHTIDTRDLYHVRWQGTRQSAGKKITEGPK